MEYDVLKIINKLGRFEYNGKDQDGLRDWMTVLYGIYAIHEKSLSSESNDAFQVIDKSILGRSRKGDITENGFFCMKRTLNLFEKDITAKLKNISC